MKLTASGVTFSAAIIRSPSFSRSSSSTMMISRPSCICSRACSIVANGIRFQKRFHIFCDDVIFEIYSIAGFGGPQIGIFQCVRDDGDGKSAGAQCGNGQTDAVDRNRALLDNVTGGRFGSGDLQVPTVTGPVEIANVADAIDMSLDNVA